MSRPRRGPLGLAQRPEGLGPTARGGTAWLAGDAEGLLVEQRGGDGCQAVVPSEVVGAGRSRPVSWMSLVT